MTLYEHSSLVRQYAEYEDAASCAERFARQSGVVCAIVRDSYYDGARWHSGYNAMSWDAMLAERLDPSAIVAFRWPVYPNTDPRRADLFALYEAQLVGDERAIAAALDG